MATRMRKEDVKRINTLLASQKQALDSLHIFQDHEQDESLNNRSHHIRNNYKYLQKIDRAEDMIKEAKHISEQRIQQARNTGIKKNAIKNQSSNALIFPVDEHPNPTPKALPALNPSQKETKAPSRQDRTSFMENRVEEQISRIEDLRASREKHESILPQEIVEGQIKKSIVDIDCILVKNYFREKMRGITSQTSPQQLYKIFHPFYELCGIKLSLPLIKKYRNCAYFGESNKQNQLARYEGFLIFHQEEKLYFGQLLNEKKNGRGTQIDFRSDVMYTGVFSKGKKVGVFKVTKPNQTYVGTLEKGQYQGYGQLNNEFSQYKGHFERGLRHGEGEQRFLKIGLTICGTFINNTFTNNSQKLQHSHLNTINRNKMKKTTIVSKANPQSQRSYSKDKNVVFESSAYSRQNYQQFDYQFAGEDEEDEEIEIIKTQKNPTFRIKQVKEPTKLYSDRKRVTSEQKSQFLYPSRRN